MNTIHSKKRKKPLITITKSMMGILKYIHFCRFATAQEVCRLFYSPKSLSHVREILSLLTAANYLHRFELPHTSRGNTEKFYTLSGRKSLANELGLPVDWHFRLRPYKVKHLSYRQVQHNLLLTRWLAAAQVWAAKQPDFKLIQTRICYEIAKAPPTVEVSKETQYASKQRKIERLKVIPDAWVCFEKLKNGEHEHFIPVLLEIDRGSEYKQKFKRHVHSRIEFIRSGAYRKLFETEAVLIVYVTTGDRIEYGESRCRAMSAWTQEVLADLHMENWSNIFRFTSVVFEELYTTPIFDQPVWYRPDSAVSIPLFTL